MGLGCVTHIFNESMMLPHWIEWHKQFINQLIVIDQGCTDNSMDIIRQEWPGALIIKSKYEDFNVDNNDKEVIETESLLNTKWKLTLNATEFIWEPHFEDKLEFLSLQNPDIKAFGMDSYCVIDEGESFVIDRPLPKYYTYGFMSGNRNGIVSRHVRFVHRGENGQYGTGRHSTQLPNKKEDLCLLHFTFAPWPQCIDRKLQIQTRIPQCDKNEGKGIQHLQTKDSMVSLYKVHKQAAGDLLQDYRYKERYEEFFSG